MKIVSVKGLKIGEGSPKIIIPIVDKTRTSIIEKAKVINELKFDMVEWRADCYEDVFDSHKVLDTLSELRKVIPDKPLIFTFRTHKEGGLKEISDDYYLEINKIVSESGNIDLVDIEVLSINCVVEEFIRYIKKTGVFIVGSYHVFTYTPPKEVMVSKLCKMQEIGVDITKIAVMPKSKEDVVTLLDATLEMYTKYANRPLITMSMGPLGVISRLSGEVFGSAATFGSVGKSSAPGQLQVGELASVLDVLHNAMNNGSSGS